MQQLSVSRLFDGEQWFDNVSVNIDNCSVHSVVPAVGNIQSGMLVPGFIDVQVNGGGGALFNAIPNLQSLRTMLRAHAQFGTTAMLPTVITDNVAVMQQAADAIATAIAAQEPGIIGVHFEGPHLSVAKKGVHSEHYIRPLSAAELAIYARTDLGVKLVTVAPENVSPAQISQLVALNVIVCLGHSNADAATVQAALAAGASGFTHLYNAMSPLTSREPGMVGVALSDPNSWCGIILDGHHLHPVAAKVALAAKPQGKLMLVTDAMSPVGTNDTEFDFFSGKVVRDGSKLTNEAGSLAGSVLDMAGAVQYAVQQLDVSPAEALRMASLYPAQFLSRSNAGRIVVGAPADFVFINDNWQVLACWINGQPIYNAL
ncbi:N-acetylglucosamine-6-phosphate deacetylase [Rheinheimera sp. D18]|uniref:N-acetylglucosamine-6-phosphate deacetylase n=1 Tax=Rheinheimera sp. D18 TaxID=2545632 RepID=UPI00104A1BE3|nr:N-acetylglucosamine-6-phosphate deacetylase [Rheinheimera sp. D18]QBL10371.1 N-acetylglucosamine-6-phosphate deacetylase [Rheinheimera sp. D18]